MQVSGVRVKAALTATANFIAFIVLALPGMLITREVVSQDVNEDSFDGSRRGAVGEVEVRRTHPVAE